MMRMFGFIVCISTLSSFSATDGSRTGKVSGSAKLLSWEEVAAVIGCGSLGSAVTDPAGSVVAPKLFPL